MVRQPTKNGASYNVSATNDDPVLGERDPEIARAVCCKWYYTIHPPGRHGLSAGADCSDIGEYADPSPDDKDTTPLGAALRELEREQAFNRECDEWLTIAKKSLRFPTAR